MVWGCKVNAKANDYKKYSLLFYFKVVKSGKCKEQRGVAKCKNATPPCFFHIFSFITKIPSRQAFSHNRGNIYMT